MSMKMLAEKREAAMASFIMMASCSLVFGNMASDASSSSESSMITERRYEEPLVPTALVVMAARRRAYDEVTFCLPITLLVSALEQLKNALGD